MTAYLYQNDELPDGFVFPRAFLNEMKRDPIPYPEPWWYLTEFSDEAQWWIRELNRKYPKRSLVPFAKRDVYDDIACFDGSGGSSDPLVLIINYGASEDWELSDRCDNFEAWLQEISDSA